MRTVAPRVPGALLWVFAFSCPAERPGHEVKAAFVYHFGEYVRWPSPMRAERRVQFEINRDAVERASLSPSAQLLRLARALVDTRIR